MFLTAYKYLYYRIYAWNLRVWGESDLPQFNALFGVSFLIFLNIMTLLDLVDLCAGRHVVPFSRPAVIGTVLVVIVIGYFILVHNGKYRTIAKEFSNETLAQRRRRFVASVIYVTLSFVTSFSIVSIRNS